MKMVHDSTFRGTSCISLESQDQNIAEVSSPSSVSSSYSPPCDSTSFPLAPPPRTLPRFSCDRPEYPAIDRYRDDMLSTRDGVVSVSSSPYHAYADSMRYSYPSFHA
jgi:hypothetical protein